jgi:hypothetical protein
MKHAQMLFIVICSLLALFPFAANALTFTLSDDAIMALDYNESTIYHPPYYGGDTHLLAITDVNGPGVQFDILFSDPQNKRGQSPAFYWNSSLYGGKGVLAGRDISMFDAFALKFTLLSAKGVSLSDSKGPVYVGSMLTRAHSLWGFYPVVIEIDDSYNPVSTTSLITTDAVSQMNTVGFVCYLPYWWYDESYPNPWDPCGAIVSVLVEPAPGAVVLTSDPDQVLQLVSIDKCTVAAGSKAGSDKITFSGKMTPVYDDLYLTNFIQIAVGSDDMADPCAILIPINNDKYKKTGKFSYSGTDADGVRKSFKLDFKTHKFSFTARNLDLSGLSCPLSVGVDIAGFSADTNVDETIVNGPTKLMPINLLMGVKNSLRVDKLKIKYGNTQALIVSGGFSAQKTDVNMAAEKLSVTLGSQTFTIPAKSFRPNKTKTRFACSNVKLDGGIGIAAATFDFNKGTFALTIKTASIDAYPGTTENFAINSTDFAIDTDVLIPYSFNSLYPYVFGGISPQ